MRTVFFTIGLLGLGAFFVVQGSIGRAEETLPTYVVEDAREVHVSAISWGVYDVETGERIIAHNEHEVLPVASITKLMTAFTAHSLPDIDEPTVLSPGAVATFGRAGSLRVGEALSARELLFPLLIESSNDAAEALAEIDGRSTFLAHMNLSATRFGLESTSFEDPSGLSPLNVSSVSDQARFLTYLYRNARHLLDITTLRRYVGEEHTWVNVNPVAASSAFRGGKHGYTDEAGRTLAALFDVLLLNGEVRTVVVILLGSDNLPDDMAALLNLLSAHVRYE